MSRYSNATLCQQGYAFRPIAQYEPDRLRGSERSTLQNFLLRQFNFPSEIWRGEHFIEIWSSQIDKALWSEALGLLEVETRTGSFLLDDSTNESFLAMCQKVIGKAFRATGGSAVLFTDGGNRPIIRLHVVCIDNSTRSLYNDNEGPHILSLDELLAMELGDQASIAASSWGSVARELSKKKLGRFGRSRQSSAYSVPLAEAVTV